MKSQEKIVVWLKQNSSFGPWVECSPEDSNAVMFVANATGTVQENDVEWAASHLMPFNSGTTNAAPADAEKGSA